jgi:hypothetical protein
MCPTRGNDRDAGARERRAIAAISPATPLFVVFAGDLAPNVQGE